MVTTAMLAKKIYLEMIRFKKVLLLVDHDYDVPYEAISKERQDEFINLANWIVLGRWRENDSQPTGKVDTSAASRHP